jgi:deazaflavin-dependent oxidoreductase (nitroreductase family)
VNQLVEAETSVFRTLNAVSTPWIRLGFGSSSFLPAGLTVLETIGRRSGQAHETPLQAFFFPGGAVVGTYRAGRSDWLKNAQATPGVRYWINGAPRAAQAEVCPGPAGWAVAVLRDVR